MLIMSYKLVAGRPAGGTPCEFVGISIDGVNRLAWFSFVEYHNSCLYQYSEHLLVDSVCQEKDSRSAMSLATASITFYLHGKACSS